MASVPANTTGRNPAVFMVHLLIASFRQSGGYRSAFGTVRLARNPFYVTLLRRVLTFLNCSIFPLARREIGGIS